MSLNFYMTLRPIENGLFEYFSEIRFLCGFEMYCDNLNWQVLLKEGCTRAATMKSSCPAYIMAGSVFKYQESRGQHFMKKLKWPNFY